jgi:3-methyladenine DNA glycosylase AlkD
MTYSEFIKKLNAVAEPSYAEFSRGLTPTKYKMLGVRVPTLRKFAKKILVEHSLDDVLTFPNEYFEVVFIKLLVVAALPYEIFMQYVENCVALIDNWAHCDCFKANCIKKHKQGFKIY